uniref:Uncharacterized protein n=1 Tax=Acrobeloides nanus TaxID=290746 RepID=A0A914E446_9BILA
MLFNIYFLVSADAEPGTWTPWVDNGCTDTCGMCGVVQQIRECLVPGTCTGSSIQNTTLSCTSNVCFFPRPACCPGYKRGFVDGQITCILSTNGPPDNNEPKSLGTWSQWIESGCTDTCGLCGVTRMKRDCLVVLRIKPQILLAATSLVTFPEELVVLVKDQ